MFRLSPSALRLATGAFLLSHKTLARASFQPFTQQDEDDLVRVVKTKPRHVLKHVRQQVWRSRKRELQFRNTVTQLMIVLQEFLRKQLIDPADASLIMEGVLEECVVYAQHDMAHLLFRAFLRFRKYGCTISVQAIRHLFESYRSNDSIELMIQLATEMKDDPALRPLCVAAYLFAGQEKEAEALQEGLSVSELSTEDFVALVDGYGKLQNGEKVLALVERLQQRNLPPAEAATVYSALLRVCRRLPDPAVFNQVLQTAVEAQVPLDAEAFSLVLRQKMAQVTTLEEVQTIEAELKQVGYVPDVTGNAIIITAYARLMHFGDRASEELMLSKVDTLLSSIESRLKQGDPDMDISGAHIRAVIRGYGAAGRADAMKSAWARMQYDGLTNDVRVYNELFKWLALMGNVKDVLALKEEMEAKTVRADALTYTWVLRALGKYYPRHVQQLYEELKARHVRPDIHLYNTLLGVLGDIGRYEDVQSLYSEMQRREAAGSLQLSPITYAILIRLYHQKDVPLCMDLFQEATKRNLASHPHVQTSILHALSNQLTSPAAVSASSAAEYQKKLDDVLASLPQRSTDVYNVLLNLYAKQMNKAKFEETLQKMRDEQVQMNDVTFGTLITAFARWGEADKVEGVIQILKESEGEVSPAFYSVLASSLQRLGHRDGVTEAWEDLLASKLFPNTQVYNQFLSLYSRQHNVPKMQGVLDSMMRQVPPNPVTATTVLDMLGKSGRVAEMEALFEDMKQTADTQPTSVTYHQMMNAYAKSGDVVKMEQVHEMYLAQGHTNNAVTYNILMDGYGRAKRFEQMEELVTRRREQDHLPLDDLSYCIMVSTYGKARMLKDVQRLFRELTAARDDETSAPASSVLTRRVVWSLIDAFCRCEDLASMDACIGLLQPAQTATTPPAATNDGAEAASTPPASASPSKAAAPLTVSDRMTLIPYFSRMGQMERVEELEASLANDGEPIHYNALNAMARGYAKAGRFDKCVKCLHKLRDRQWAPDATTAMALSGAFLKAGLHDQAKQVIEWRRKFAKAAGSSHDEPE